MSMSENFIVFGLFISVLSKHNFLLCISLLDFEFIYLCDFSYYICVFVTFDMQKLL